jgi:hypothetical protein
MADRSDIFRDHFGFVIAEGTGFARSISGTRNKQTWFCQSGAKKSGIHSDAVADRSCRWTDHNTLFAAPEGVSATCPIEGLALPPPAICCY